MTFPLIPSAGLLSSALKTMAREFSVAPFAIMRAMGEVINTIIGITVFVVMIGSAIGWLINVFTGRGGSYSDFDTKDPGDDFD